MRLKAIVVAMFDDQIITSMLSRSTTTRLIRSIYT